MKEEGFRDGVRFSSTRTTTWEKISTYVDDPEKMQYALPTFAETTSIHSPSSPSKLDSRATSAKPKKKL
jgi:hypothetical protein